MTLNSSGLSPPKTPESDPRTAATSGYALSFIEDMLLGDLASHVRDVLDAAMLADPSGWAPFYPQDPAGPPTRGDGRAVAGRASTGPWIR